MSIIVHLTVNGGDAAISFYKQAFGARESGARILDTDGRIGHATLEVGGSTFYLNDEYPDMGAVSPPTLGGTSAGLHLAVDDVDRAYAAAVAAGARGLREPEDQFYGERSCTIEDPFGHRWFLDRTVEEVSDDELARRVEGEYTVERDVD